MGRAMALQGHWAVNDLEACKPPDLFEIEGIALFVQVDNTRVAVMQRVGMRCSESNRFQWPFR